MSSNKKVSCDLCEKEHSKKVSIEFEGKHFCSIECYMKYIETLDRKDILKAISK